MKPSSKITKVCPDAKRAERSMLPYSKEMQRKESLHLEMMGFAQRG